MEYILNFASALLTFFGGALSFYFYGVYSNFFSYNQKIVPVFFHLSSTECTSIIDSSYGRIVGVSNVFVGFIYLFIHTLVLIATGYNFLPQFIPFLLSIFSLTVGVYLIYGLFKLKIKCKICISVHIINFLVFFMQIPLFIK